MKGMTGYGYAEFQNAQVHISLEVKSYNNRYLDMLVNLPSSLNSLEPRIRDFLAERVERGRVEVYVKLIELSTDASVILDENMVRAYRGVVERLGELAHIEPVMSVSDYLGLDGVLKLDTKRDIETYWNILLPLIEEAFTRLEAMRNAEGEATRRDIEGYLSQVEKALCIVEANAASLEERIRTSLKERFFELLGESMDEGRVYAETAVLLVKCTINEECSRIRNHLAHFKKTLDDTAPMGKRLDFIAQELNREVNTIGSKSTLYEVNQAVVDMKDAIENIREQLRNVE